MSSRSNRSSPKSPTPSRPRATPKRHTAAPPAPHRLTGTTSIVDQPSAYTPQTVRALREKLGASQRVFAELVGVSKSLVEHWEAGIRVPSPLACRLLDSIQTNPQSFLDRLTREVTR